MLEPRQTELLEKLVTTCHLNMPERRELRMEKVPKRMLIERLVHLLERDGRVAGPVGEVFVSGPGKYEIRYEVETGMLRTQTIVNSFSNISQAAAEFVALILRAHAYMAPDSIDGIRIEC